MQSTNFCIGYSSMELQSTEIKESSIGLWFDDFVSTLRSHQVQIETDIASKEIKELYSTLFSGNIEQIFNINKQAGQEFFVKRIIVDYLKQLDKNIPKKLAFDFNDSEVLVWAEVENDIEEFERILIMTEAFINAKYSQYGFAMNSTIVETEDMLQLPNHYKIYQA